MDSSQSVGALVQPPNPMQGIEMMSGMLGLQQRQQQLQIGGQELQQKQLVTQQMGALTNLTRQAMDPNDTVYHDKEGHFDPDKYQEHALAVAPLLPEAVNGHLSAVKNALEARRTFQNLGKETQGNFSDGLKGLASQQTISDSDIDSFRDAQRARIGNNAEGRELLGGLIAHLKAERDPDQRKTAAANASAMLGGFSQQAPAELNAGPAQVFGSKNLFSGGFTPSSAVPLGLSPTDQPAYKGRVAAVQTAATGAGGVDNQTFGNVIAAGSKAGTVTDLAQKVRDLAAQTRTGKFTQEFADQLTVLKQNDPQATMRQVMEKYANNLKTAVESTGSTDAEREQIGSGFPTPKTMNPAALEEAANYAIGQGKLAQERASNAANHYQTRGSTEGFAVNDNAFMKGKSPLSYAPKITPATSEGRVRVKSPDGRTGTIPAGRLAAYKAQGYTEAK